MNRLDVTSAVRVYERNEEEASDNAKMKVHAHWNDRDKVVLEIGRTKVTVVARDLEAAIENATNAA